MKLNFNFMFGPGRASRLRTLIFWIHLPAGVTAGLVILLMCVSGAILACQPSAIAWAERGWRSRPPTSGAGHLGVEALLERARAHRPGLRPTMLTLRADPTAPATIAMGRDGQVLLDAYSGEVLGEGATRARAFFRSVEDWHRRLAMEGEGRGAGRAVTGAANLAFLVLVATGPILWWPRRGVRAVALFQRGLTGRARDFNWHNVLGIWSALPLLVMVATATVFSYDWANTLLFGMVGEAPPARSRPGGNAPGSPGSPAPDLATSGLDRLWARAEAQVEGWRSITLRLPTAPEAPVTFSIDRGRGGRPDQRAQLTLDRRTAAVLSFEPYAAQSRGRQLRAWVRFSHTGEAFGAAGQAVAGLASAAGAVLVGTGLALAGRRLAGWQARRSRSRFRISAETSLTEAP
jgi:uncharacterized iron-regulated membrane protein